MKKRYDNESQGYDAWFGFKQADRRLIGQYSSVFENICIDPGIQGFETAANELKRALEAIFGRTPGLVPQPASSKGTVLLRKAAMPDNEDAQLDDEGFLIRRCKTENGAALTIFEAKTGTGALYGVYSLIRHILCGSFSDDFHIAENPAIKIRMLNQWDNMDGSIERGYAGKSIFYENDMIKKDAGRIEDYARLMASVGLNGIVLNNVNVHEVETRLITKDYLPEVARLADIFRSYGIKVFLSINYSSPVELGGLDTADPLDDRVQAWWDGKAAEIYSYIPDFGGFLVKADSEFRPGPFTYGRNHAEGANMLAKALKPYGGKVIWRCFVYNCRQDWRDRVTDRANSAYDNFIPLDGLFEDNVYLQIKNGPMDFQVREPVSPLFGGLKKSNMILELQITQEYTGQQRHLCYLAQMWKDVLDFDTYCRGKDSTVAKLLSDPCDGVHTGISAVSNIGDDMNWTGHDLAQANLYCFGRLAWDPSLMPETIAREWVLQTFGCDAAVADTITGMLMDSYHIYESYTSPLGIGWMVNPGHHYGPSVDGYEYSAWGTYHRADHEGIGVDRTVAAGTGFAGKYLPPNSTIYEDPKTCPEELLLFFHRIPYKYMLKSGVTLIQHIYDSHFEGAKRAAGLVERWKSLEGRIDPHCFSRVLARLEEQASHACEWRDVINSYFFRKSGIPDEKGRTIY